MAKGKSRKESWCQEDLSWLDTRPFFTFYTHIAGFFFKFYQRGREKMGVAMTLERAATTGNVIWKARKNHLAALLFAPTGAYCL